MRLGLPSLTRMLIYLVGVYAYVQPEASGGPSNGTLFYCNQCEKSFFSRCGRDKHIQRKHLTGNKEQCRHGCGRLFVRYSDSLK